MGIPDFVAGLFRLRILSCGAFERTERTEIKDYNHLEFSS